MNAHDTASAEYFRRFNVSIAANMSHSIGIPITQCFRLFVSLHALYFYRSNDRPASLQVNVTVAFGVPRIFRARYSGWSRSAQFSVSLPPIQWCNISWIAFSRSSTHRLGGRRTVATVPTAPCSSARATSDVGEVRALFKQFLERTPA